MKTRFLTICAGLLLALSTQATLAADTTSSAAPSNGVVAANDKNASQIDLVTILTNLKDKGYHVIYKIEVNSDGRVKIKALDAQGRDVKLKFDAQGNMTAPKEASDMGASLSMLDAIKKVLNAGYTKISSADTDEDEYEIDAYDKDGKEVSLKVNSTTGNIKQ